MVHCYAINHDVKFEVISVMAIETSGSHGVNPQDHNVTYPSVSLHDVTYQKYRT
jgi:hypothetical protein